MTQLALFADRRPPDPRSKSYRDAFRAAFRAARGTPMPEGLDWDGQCGWTDGTTNVGIPLSRWTDAGLEPPWAAYGKTPPREGESVTEPETR